MKIIIYIYYIMKYNDQLLFKTKINGNEQTYNFRKPVIKNIDNLSTYDYIYYILYVIDQIFNIGYPFNPSVTGYGTKLPEYIKEIITNIDSSKFTTMERTLKLLISSIAYIKNIDLENDDLNSIYKILINIDIYLFNQDPRIIKGAFVKEGFFDGNERSIIEGMRKKTYPFFIKLDENQRQMKFLITLMDYIDSIMAKGKSSYGIQNGLKGHDLTALNVKKISQTNIIEYLFGIHGFLLGRFLSGINIKKGISILNSVSNNFKNNNSKRTTNKELKVRANNITSKNFKEKNTTNTKNFIKNHKLLLNDNKLSKWPSEYYEV